MDISSPASRDLLIYRLVECMGDAEEALNAPLRSSLIYHLEIIG